MIIAVDFEVNSERAVQFRKWVNQIAKDYTIQGWVMDDERLLIMIKILQRREDSMRLSGIKCIMPFMDIRRQDRGKSGLQKI